MTSTFSRLPKNVSPVNYNLELKPDFKSFTFEGQVAIEVNVNSETDTILLNSAQLTFDRAVFEYSNNTKLNSQSVFLSETNEIATITFGQKLTVGKGKLHISFSGILNDRLKGFYKSKYVHPSGEERFAAITQFEAADARRAFPCWDEPAIKATFDINIIADGDKTVISNMPLIDAAPVEGNLKRFRFQQTPIMSTYLVAFAIGEFDFVEDTDSNGILIRCYTPLGKKELGKFALSLAVKTLPFYTDYFKISYPLPKLDMLAAADLSFGAMENWGLVIYRESRLLYDPKNSTLSSKQIVARIVGHELAHQWFGNIVTMEWWTHLWLNEGFATWIEYLCVDKCLPELDIWTNFITDDFNKALQLDSLKNSHPIEVPVGSPSEVDEIFDAISYSKGASVIRMLHNYIGDDAFREGLHNYLKKFKYKNVVTEDLWDALSNPSNKPINELMQGWTKQTGYPVITVSSSLNSEGETILKLHQKRFFTNGAKPTPEEDYLWKIPITIVTKSSFPNVHKQVLLEKENDQVNLGKIGANDWIKLNNNTIGIYRVNYSLEMLEKLSELIKSQSIHPADRLGLISDIFALSFAGMLPAYEVLKFVQNYSVEENFIVWQGLIENLNKMSLVLMNTNYQHEFKSFVRKLIKPISNKFGWDPIPGERDVTGLCRVIILKTLAANGDSETIEEARKRFSSHLNGAPINADLRSLVYSVVLSDCDESMINKFIEMHRTCDLQEEKARLVSALGSVSKENLISKVLEFSISSSTRAVETIEILISVSENSSSKLSLEMNWKFIKQNWNSIYNRCKSGIMIQRLLKSILEKFATDQNLKDVEAYFQSNPVVEAQRNIQQAIESIQVNIEWLNRNKNDLKSKLMSF